MALMLGGAEWFPTAGAPMVMTKLREKKGVERGRKEFGVFEFQRLFWLLFPTPFGVGRG